MWRIRDWDQHYENNRTRGLKRMEWVPVPNKNGLGYKRLLRHPDGERHFAAWIAILQVASKCEPRGLLAHTSSADGTAQPLDCETLAMLTDFQAATFEAAIPRLIEIGWIETVAPTGQAVAASPQEASTNPALGCGDPAPLCGDPALGCGEAPRSLRRADYGMEVNGREVNGREVEGEVEGNRTEENTPIAPKGAIAEAFEHWWHAYPRKSGKRRARRNFDKAIRSLKTGPPKRTTAEAADILLVAVRAYASSPKAQSEFCWNPATWLSGGHWEDDPAVWQRGDRTNEPTGPLLWGDD